MSQVTMENQDKVIEDRNSPPVLPPDSPGSSVSTRLQDEYSELLKYAVVLPNSDGNAQAHTGSAFQIVNGKNSPSVPQNSYTQGDEVLDINTNAREPAYTDRKEQTNQAEAQEERYYGVSIVNSSVTEMGYKLDTWLGQLKTDILNEFCQATLHTLELQQRQQEQEMKNLQCDKQQLQQEVNGLNDLINTMEESINRKDSLLENLTESLVQQKGKMNVGKHFNSWKGTVDEKKRKTFTEKIAKKFHERQLTQRVFKAWFGTVQSRWRTQVERQCQNQAQNVCKNLTTEYESKIGQLNTTIRQLQNQVSYLQQEREQYAESVKKAFMRGVCALNMEAMSAFIDENVPIIPEGTPGMPAFASSSEHQRKGNVDFNLNSCDSNRKDESQVKSLPPDLMTSTFPGGLLTSTAPTVSLTSSMPEPRSSPAGRSSQPVSISGSTVSQGNLRKPKAKGKSSSTNTRPSSALGVQGQTLAPPMATVIVERHQPITKQTVGKATALKYPKSSQAQDPQRPSSARYPAVSTSQNFRPIAGQTAVKPPPAVKVVD